MDEVASDVGRVLTDGFNNGESTVAIETSEGNVDFNIEPCREDPPKYAIGGKWQIRKPMVM